MPLFNKDKKRLVTLVLTKTPNTEHEILKPHPMKDGAEQDMMKDDFRQKAQLMMAEEVIKAMKSGDAKLFLNSLKSLYSMFCSDEEESEDY